MAQDDYYYEIQLTNKQLIFYFMAGATGLILSFLAGVMVGRGVDTAGAEAQAAQPIAEERIVSEEPPLTTPPAAEELTYSKRLEQERANDDDALETPGAVVPAATPSARPSPSPPAVARVVAASPSPAARRVTPSPSPAQRVPGGQYALQVGAFKDRAGAEATVARLKKRGYAASLLVPLTSDGLYNVRVGPFSSRPSAEAVQDKLKAERFQALIIRQ